MWARGPDLRRRRPLEVAAWLVLAGFALVALVPGLVAGLSPAGGDPLECSLRADDGGFRDMLAPSATHWFGTDALGCDLFARVVHGTRASLVIGAVGALVALALAIALGGVAGYLGGAWDRASRFVSEVTLAFPPLVGAALVLSLAGADRPTPLHVAVVLGVLSWPLLARVVRSTVRSVREETFVEASLEAGVAPIRLALTHVVPNSIGPLIAVTVLTVGALVTAEAALSYIGIGLSSPQLSWGTLFDQGQRHLRTAPHLVLFPGLALVAFVAAVVILGDVATRRWSRPGGTL